jgi:hypothetical protein
MGFKSFLYGIVYKATSSLFDEWKETEKKNEESSSEESQIAMLTGAFGKVSGVARSFGFDPFESYNAGLAVGERKVNFALNQALAPLLSELRWGSNKWNLATRDIWVSGATGAFIGKTIGDLVGTTAAIIFPYLTPFIPLFSFFTSLVGATLEAGTWEAGGYTGPGYPGRGTPDIWDALSYDWDAEGQQVDVFVEPTTTTSRARTNLSGITQLDIISAKNKGGVVLKLTMMELRHWV